MKTLSLTCALPTVLAWGVAAAAALAAPEPSGREPAAMEALNAMGEALRAKSAFEVRADVTSEEVLDSGQKIQSSGTIDLVVQRPNRFRVTMRDGRQDRDLYYDGTSLTVWAPELHYYASFDAPPTIAETLEKARANYGIEVPLVDLFTWGTDPKQVERVRSAFAVGDDEINGRRCSHYAIRQDKVDWQVWIADETDGLPCKLVITSTEDPAMPQHSAVYTWSAMPSSAAFSFVPPSGATKIAFRNSMPPSSAQDQ